MQKLRATAKTTEESSEPLKKEDIDKDQNQTAKGTTRPKKGSWISAGFMSIAIPAYCYFFGYSSFKYRLEGMGFDSPEISTTPGDVYFHAFSAFAFIGAKALPASKELLIKHFHENWILIGCISIAAVLISYLTQLFAHRKNSFLTWIEKVDDSVPTGRADRYLKKFADFFKRIVSWAFQLFNGKAPIHLIWICKSLLLGAFIYLGFFIILPLILGGLLFGAMVLIPPPALGEQMAVEDKKSFSCPSNVEELSRHKACTVVKLKDNKTYVGIIENRDQKFLYLLTKDEAKTLPIEQVAETGQQVMTGKNQDGLSLGGPYLGESLYCHQPIASFTASLLLRPN